jgi:hypothetical protein
VAQGLEKPWRQERVIAARDQLVVVAEGASLSRAMAYELANDLAMALGHGAYEPLVGAYRAVRTRVEQGRFELAASDAIALAVQLARTWDVEMSGRESQPAI